MSKPEVNLEAVKIISQHLTGADTGVIVEKESGKAATDVMALYDITNADLEKTNKFITGFTAAATQAIGEAAVNAMHADAELKSVQGELAIPHMGNMSANIVRELPNAIKPEAGPTKGAVTNKLVFGANNGNAGELRLARQHVKELAKSKL